MSTGYSLLALTGTITLPAFGHLAYKLFFREKSKFYVFAAIFCFIFTSVCTFLALQKLTLGFVYASSAITQGLILILGWRFLSENITRQHVVAISFIIFGVMSFAFSAI